MEFGISGKVVERRKLDSRPVFVQALNIVIYLYNRN